MGIGGLAARAAHLRNQMKKTPCRRCGLHYDHSSSEQCPHLIGLELQQLLAKNSPYFKVENLSV